MPAPLIWISGASGGIGSALARQNPYPGARIINLDIKPSETLENFAFDLANPGDWNRVKEQFSDELAGFTGRVMFLHCAYVPQGKGMVTEVDQGDYQRSLIANTAGSLSLAASFLRALRPEHDGGMLLMSSKAAQYSLLGYTSYSSSKVAIEKWVKIARKEVLHRGWGPWIVAARPGLVDTPTARAAANLDASVFPLGPAMGRDLDQKAMTADTAAQRLWQALPPQADQWLIDLDEESRP